jgi:VanZ family protein
MRPGQFLKYFLPILIWMVLIFGGSTELGAPKNTSRIIGPILRWFNPKITERTIDKIQFAVRKCGHATEYAILCLLIWRTVRNLSGKDPRKWSWNDARLAILFSALYAGTDEFHQTFVTAREGRVTDVLIDSLGAIAAMLVLWKIGHYFKRW